MPADGKIDPHGSCSDSLMQIMLKIVGLSSLDSVVDIAPMRSQDRAKTPAAPGQQRHANAI